MGGYYKARHGEAPQGDGLARFLLTGFARCSSCGGALGGSTQLHGSGPASNRHRVSFYGCTYNRKRGEHVCANRTTIKTGIVDEVRERVRKKAADLRGVLKRGTPDARAALAKLLSGKLDAEPVVIDGRRGYRLTGNVNVTGLLPDAMISRLQARMSNSPLVVAPTGFEPVFQP